MRYEPMCLRLAFWLCEVYDRWQARRRRARFLRENPDLAAAEEAEQVTEWRKPTC